jgi:hypothetical protein
MWNGFFGCRIDCPVDRGGSMRSQPVRLPSRFPVGTRYVIEGGGGPQERLRIWSRYLEFPDGRHLDLPLDRPDRARLRRPQRRAVSN